VKESIFKAKVLSQRQRFQAKSIQMEKIQNLGNMLLMLHNKARRVPFDDND